MQTHEISQKAAEDFDHMLAEVLLGEAQHELKWLKACRDRVDRLNRNDAPKDIVEGAIQDLDKAAERLAERYRRVSLLVSSSFSDCQSCAERHRALLVGLA